MLKYLALVALIAFGAALAKPPKCRDCKEEVWTNSNQTCDDADRWRECLNEIKDSCDVDWSEVSTENAYCAVQKEKGLICSEAKKKCTQRQNIEDIENTTNDRDELCRLAQEWRSCLEEYMTVRCRVKIPGKVAEVQAMNEC